MGRTGVWLIGARGSVATTAIVGAAAVRAGAAAPSGCTAELPDFAGAELPGLGDLVFGGHDIVDTPLLKRAEQLVQSGVVPAALPQLVAADLEAAEAEIRPASREAGNQGEAIAWIVEDLTAFRARHDLEEVVVVNVSSTEPPCEPHPAHESLAALDIALAGPDPVLPASSLYAYAAFARGLRLCRLHAVDRRAPARAR